MFRRSGFRFAAKNMRHPRAPKACPDSEGNGARSGLAARAGSSSFRTSRVSTQAVAESQESARAIERGGMPSMSTATIRLALFAARFVTRFMTLLGVLALVSGAAHAEGYPS